jgi:hydrogenase small subunit
VQHFGEVVNAWPIGLGHPCVGCTEQSVAFRVPMHATVEIARPTPPDTYAPIGSPQGTISPLAASVAGAIVGGLAGAGYVASKSLSLHDRPGETRPTPEV